MKIIISFIICLLQFSSCTKNSKYKNDTESFYPTSKPCTRWWWFATEIKKEDIKYQLVWMKEMNFGGVEICWLFPLYRYQKMYEEKYNRFYPKDTSAQIWLSDEWSEIVAYTKQCADSLGLSCDFTFGSAWTIAATYINKEHRTQIYGDSVFSQPLSYAWTYPDTQWVINHLDKNAFEIYADPIANALKEALKGSKSTLFTDSWEIKLNAKNKIWTPGFENTFQEEFGYHIIPYMDAGLDSFPDVRYDYMLHLEEKIIEGYYKPFAEKCRDLGANSRVQCLGAPGDIMTLYSFADIPETEAMLNNPHFARIVSSSATLANKKIVSSETFTCMYGFPGTYMRKEQMADVKMLADALFAQGVNHLIYHGTPYNPKGSDSIEFFASTYFGPNGSLSPELPAFNKYVEQVCGLMQNGKAYSDVAIYLPYEDGVMKGEYPKEKQRVWVWGEYELRYIYPPEETQGHQPIWINRHFLEQAHCENNKLVVGDAVFNSLYICVDYIDIRALKNILKFAQQGLPVCLKKNPKQPGLNKSPEFDVMVKELSGLKNVSANFKQINNHPPILEGENLPEFWCKVLKDKTHYIFLAQPKSINLTYPIYCGQSIMNHSEFREITINVNGNKLTKRFEFKPYQSLLLKISPKGEMEFIDITFIPKDPIVKPKEEQKIYF